MAAKTYSTRSNARAGAKTAGLPAERIEIVEVAGGRFMWMDRAEQGETEQAPVEAPAEAPVEVPAGWDVVEGGGSEDDAEQTMEAIQARNAARRAAAEQAEPVVEHIPGTADRFRVVLPEAEVYGPELPPGGVEVAEAAQDAQGEALDAVAAPAGGEAPAAPLDLRAALLAGLTGPRAADPGLDEADPRAAEEMACTFSFPCSPALARELARLVAKRADVPVLVAFADAADLGWTQEPRAARVAPAVRQPRAAKPKAERVPSAGGRSTYDPAAVVRVLVPNPKREGTAAYERFALYRDGQPLSASLDAGVTRGDVSWDVNRGFIRLDPVAPVAPVEQAAQGEAAAA